MTEISEEQALNDIAQELSGKDGIHAYNNGGNVEVDVNGNTAILEYEGMSQKGEKRYEASTCCLNGGSSRAIVESLGEAAGQDYWIVEK